MIKNPRKVNMNYEEKIFADGILGAFGEEIFSFAVTSGRKQYTYAVTPKIMKQISKWITSQVKEYEDRFGEIEDNYQP